LNNDNNSAIAIRGTRNAEIQMGIVEMARMDMVCVENAELAAQTGAADALFELGLMYSTGRDVEPDLVTAHKWFNLAALRGNKAALEYRKELAFEMSQFDVAEAQKSAREWLNQH
jgi:uncharacterized protein